MNTGTQMQMPADLSDVDAIVSMVRKALTQRPSAPPVPCGAVVLPQPEPVRIFWSDGAARCCAYDVHSRPTHMLKRARSKYEPPCWLSYEWRYDERGKAWISDEIHMVDNGFGELVEVPLS